jgi:hypothetical protein
MRESNLSCDQVCVLTWWTRLLTQTTFFFFLISVVSLCSNHGDERECAYTSEQLFFFLNLSCDRVCVLTLGMTDVQELWSNIKQAFCFMSVYPLQSMTMESRYSNDKVLYDLYIYRKDCANKTTAVHHSCRQRQPRLSLLVVCSSGRKEQTDLWWNVAPYQNVRTKSESTNLNLKTLILNWQPKLRSSQCLSLSLSLLRDRVALAVVLHAVVVLAVVLRLRSELHRR